MQKEIERKFLLKEGYSIEKISYVNKYNIADQYLSDTVRVRNVDNDEKWVITVKNKGDIERTEFNLILDIKPEYNQQDFPVLNKIRLIAPYKQQNFEINMFKDILYKDKPLITIELELQDKDQVILFPEWVGKEVTYDKRFYGFNLCNILKYKDFKIV